MKVLLDTHILLWALTNDARLPDKARKLIENEENEVFYSIVSPWEVEIKHIAHPDSMSVAAEELTEYCEQAGFQRMLIREKHIYALSGLTRSEGAPPHRDPFDRIMVCQATTENMVFLTHDALLSYYDEPCIFVV